MKYYPIFLNLRERRCVVVGGGPVAERKARGLVAAGAKVRLISPEGTVPLARLAARKKLTLRRRRYRKGDLKGSFLVFAATDDRKVQEAVAREAREVRALLNSADDPKGSDFLVPARFSRGRLQAAISTGGSSPALAKLLRQQLDTLLEKGISARLASLSKLRQQLKSSIPKQIGRARVHRFLAAEAIKKSPKIRQSRRTKTTHRRRPGRPKPSTKGS